MTPTCPGLRAHLRPPARLLARAFARPLAAALAGSLAVAALALTPYAASTAAPAATATAEADREGHPGARKRGAPVGLRVATFNASLNRFREGDLVEDLSTPDDPQAQAVAEIVQRTRPDVLLLNEFDYVAGGEAVDLFRDNYLEVGQGGAAPIDYPYAFVAPSNTGVPSGFDLNNDGRVGGGDDAYGFGLFPGQYGMVVLSRHPIDHDAVRTFRRFRWADMPGALLPDDPATAAPADWYSPAELAELRLSSKSHWDVPVEVGGRTVHLLASHPTPPTFDGAEDRNGRRNHDEIRFWADYVAGGQRARYVYDDAGVRGGLQPGARFVVAGDQNADPLDGDSVGGAIRQLTGHPRVEDPLPASAGGVEAARVQGGANDAHRGDAAYDTADFNDRPAPGNLRVDYVLPSRSLRVAGAGVFWPELADPLSRLTGTYPFPSSDHRLVWVDLVL